MIFWVKLGENNEFKKDILYQLEQAQKDKEHNRNVARSNELYGSINSNIKKVDSVEK